MHTISLYICLFVCFQKSGILPAYQMPMPVWTFLEEYDLSGETVIPFFSHNGSSSGANSVNWVAELAKGAKVLTDKALSIPGNSVSNSQKEVKEWAAEFKKQ